MGLLLLFLCFSLPPPSYPLLGLQTSNTEQSSDAIEWQVCVYVWVVYVGADTWVTLSVCLFVRLFACISVCLHVACWSVCVIVCLYNCIFVRFYVFLRGCDCVRARWCNCVYARVCIFYDFVCACVCACVCVSVCVCACVRMCAYLPAQVIFALCMLVQD